MQQRARRGQERLSATHERTLHGCASPGSRLLRQDAGVKGAWHERRTHRRVHEPYARALPKAERAQLPAELQQRLAAWTTKASTDDNVFLTLARSPGVLELFVHWAAFMYTGVSRLEPSIMERCRLRLAARNHCVHGSLARSASLMRKGLSEAQVEAALGDLDRADLPAKTMAALRLVDLLRAPHPVIDTATYQRLREHLDDHELLELGAALSVASGWQRFIEAFGIRPDSWTEALPLPWQEDAL